MATAMREIRAREAQGSDLVVAFAPEVQRAPEHVTADGRSFRFVCSNRIDAAIAALRRTTPHGIVWSAAACTPSLVACYREG